MRSWLAGIAFGALLCAGVAFAAASPQESVDARVAAMKKMGGALKAGTDLKASSADQKTKLGEARKIAESIPTLFPKGTGIGDAGVTKSRALQDIWAKPGEFKASAEKLVTLLKAAEASVDTGDQTKMGTAFNAIGAGCKGCHDGFRGPDVH